MLPVSQIWLFFSASSLSSFLVNMKKHCFQFTVGSVGHWSWLCVSPVLSGILFQKSLKAGFNSSFLQLLWPLHLNFRGKNYNLKWINFGFSIDNIFFTPIDLTKCKPSWRTTPCTTVGQKSPTEGRLSGNFSLRLSHAPCTVYCHTQDTSRYQMFCFTVLLQSSPCLTHRVYCVWQSWCES